MNFSGCPTGIYSVKSAVRVSAKNNRQTRHSAAIPIRYQDTPVVALVRASTSVAISGLMPPPMIPAALYAKEAPE